MKAHVLHAVGYLSYEDIPKPVAKDDEVIVHVKASGICGSDISRVFKTGTYHFPTVIGHEFSGIVDSVSNPHYRHLIGKRVGVFPLKPCFKCDNCLRGNFEMCSNYDYLGSRCNGGFEEYVAVPVWNLIELPENVSYEEAAMLEPAAVAFHAIKQLGNISGKTVTIIGPGPIGNIMGKVARLKGASKIIVIGRTQEKLNFAKQYCADYIINTTDEAPIEAVKALTTGQGPEIVIEGTGANQCLSLALQMVRPGGEILLVGNPQGNYVLEKDVYWQILRKQLTLVGTWNSSFKGREDDWTEVLAAIASGELDVNPLISHRFPFDDLEGGLKVMTDSKQFSSKVMLVKV